MRLVDLADAEPGIDPLLDFRRNTLASLVEKLEFKVIPTVLKALCAIPLTNEQLQMLVYRTSDERGLNGITYALGSINKRLASKDLQVNT